MFCSRLLAGAAGAFLLAGCSIDLELEAKQLLQNLFKVGGADEIERTYRELVIELKYFQGRPVIEEIRRISRPGLRIYRRKDKLPKLLGGLGLTIVSTSAGLMSDRAARARGLGGEIICVVS